MRQRDQVLAGRVEQPRMPYGTVVCEDTRLAGAGSFRNALASETRKYTVSLEKEG